MEFRKILQVSIGGTVLGVATISAQAQNPAAQNAQQIDGNTPVYKVNVIEYVQRSTKAVNYQHRGGATKIDFEGTPLLPKANGEAKVETKQGYTEIEVEFDDLKPASQFGPEYLTYVAWAITPEGRATNLGEVILNGNRSKLNVTTELPAFSMIVTAEPYFGVTQPSDRVVMENIMRGDTKGQVELVDTSYQLLKQGSYTGNLPPGSFQAVQPNSKMPLDLLEANNAIKIAKAAGAEQYAPSTISKAEAEFSEAQKYTSKNSTMKMAVQSARQAVQTAEDARLVSLEKAEAARTAEERRVAEQKTAAANEQAAIAARRARAEEAARRDAELAQRNAEATAERAAADSQRAAADQAKAEAAQAQALVARQQAERDAQQARDAAAKAEAERVEAREQLQKQLNSVLETRESARGLVANLSDVLFDVGKATLKPDAREKLAKVAGILLAHPDLKLDIEGFTDSTGSDETNQRLSEARAAAARDFLVSQGLNSNSITSKGFGESNPIASNDNSAGRAQNRRVELVISGASIQGAQSPNAERTRTELK